MSVDIDPDDFDACAIYRLAYHHAAREISISRGSTRGGYRRVDLDDLARLLDVSPDDVRGRAILRMGVEDAEAGRRPRW